MHVCRFLQEDSVVPLNFSDALRYGIMAAEQGLVAAQKNVADFYSTGLGVPKNMERTAHYYKLAADQGDEKSQSLLGSYYLHGFVIGAVNETKPLVILFLRQHKDIQMDNSSWHCKQQKVVPHHRILMALCDP